MDAQVGEEVFAVQTKHIQQLFEKVHEPHHAFIVVANLITTITVDWRFSGDTQAPNNTRDLWGGMLLFSQLSLCYQR